MPIIFWPIYIKEDKDDDFDIEQEIKVLHFAFKWAVFWIAVLGVFWSWVIWG